MGETPHSADSFFVYAVGTSARIFAPFMGVINRWFRPSSFLSVDFVEQYEGWNAVGISRTITYDIKPFPHKHKGRTSIWPDFDPVRLWSWRNGGGNP